jgi:FkbM family methyltransferase
LLVDALVAALRPVRFRGKGRLLGPLVPHAGERTATVFGARIDLDLRDLVQREIYLGVFESKETRWALDWLRPGMTFVDVGANVGYYTLLAAQRVGAEGRVLAVEPGPYAYQRLCDTVSRNRLDQVRTLKVALGEQAGTLPLYVPPEASRNYSPTMVPHPSGTAVDTVVRTLDDCLEEWGVERVDLLKLDVEGFEPAVLRGARRALAGGRIGAVLCEFNDYWLREAGTSPTALYKTLTTTGLMNREPFEPFAPGRVETRFFVRRADA